MNSKPHERVSRGYLMTIQAEPITAADFEAFVHLPENRDRRFEFVEGEMREVVSNNYSSQVAALVTFFIHLHLRELGISGHVTGADGGYIIGADRYIPDVAFISAQRQPEPSHEAYNPLPPDLAVEVLSPTDDAASVRVKTVNYLHAGVTVWIIDPEKRQVEVYIPGQTARILAESERIGDIPALPGFTLNIRDIFPAQPAESESPEAVE